jgi:hypothetical protein
MAHGFLAGRDAAYVMRPPPDRELRAALSKALQERDKSRIASPKIMRRTKLGYHPFRLVSPSCSEEAARGRPCQHADEDIAILFCQAAESKDFVCSSIPRENVPSATGNVGGLIQAFDYASDGCGYALAEEYATVRVAGECPQMAMFGFAETQSTRERIDRGDRGADRASLFQPDVPVDTDARKFGHLLASEARSPPPAPVWKTDRLGA